jgi:hypothetical protein
MRRTSQLPFHGSSDVLLVSSPILAKNQADTPAGVATEVELGRLEGGEAGLRQIEGTIFTDPTKAEHFLKEYVNCCRWRRD